MRSIRTNELKYIRNFGDRPLVYLPKDIWDGPAGQEMKDEFYGSRRPEEELYDLRSDPLEQRNLIGDPDYQDAAWTLRTRVQNWMEESNDPLLYGDYPPAKLQRERAEQQPSDN